VTLSYILPVPIASPLWLSLTSTCNLLVRQASLRPGSLESDLASTTMLIAQVSRTRLAPVPFVRISARVTVIRKLSALVDLPVPNKRKVWESADEAVKDVKSGDVLLCGGME